MQQLAALPVPDTVTESFDRLCSFAAGPVCVAVSGGGDSLALLVLAAAWAKRRGRTILSFTVDHRLRPEAAAEARHVAGISRDLGIRHETLAWAAPKAGQAVARAARHDLLAGAAAQADSRLILTAHTEDDQAETVLIRARSGSGWYGLAGIQTLAVTPATGNGSDALVARPLLGMSREALRGVLTAEGLRWIEDPSNSDPRFERVRMRRLLAEVPGLRAGVLSCQNGLQAFRTVEDRALGRWLDGCVRSEGEGISISGGLPEGERGVRALSLVIQLTTMRARPPRADAMVRLARRLGTPRPFRAATLGGAIISAGDGIIHLKAEQLLDLPVVNAIPARLAAFRTVCSGKP
ncbi:MAG: tRNA lysidine(34) synthetase TilS [Hyphomonas sp.]|uniref:tRNA lysidine(34) synthetase TilS n=1 Tax=Hyphomonas sp. TaxID=87 RepID=UPI0035281818